jgi:hypothetical protein
VRISIWNDKSNKHLIDMLKPLAHDPNCSLNAAMSSYHSLGPDKHPQVMLTLHTVMWHNDRVQSEQDLWMVVWPEAVVRAHGGVEVRT